MNEPIGYIEGTGIIKSDEIFEEDVKDAIKSITGGLTWMNRKDGSYNFYGLIVNDDEGWQKQFADLLQKYFIKADVETDVDGEKEKFWITADGTAEAVIGKTITYFEGFEDEFITEIPDNVLDLIEKRIKERDGLL